ncbi:MAG TPA: hypothetical protein VGL19_17110 [Polyangiaceae bacterium]
MPTAAGTVTPRALEGAGGDVLRGLAPASGDRFLFKPRYSGFDAAFSIPFVAGHRRKYAGYGLGGV